MHRKTSATRWKPETVRSSHWRCSAKKVFLKRPTAVSEPVAHRSLAKQVFLNNSQISQKKICSEDLFCFPVKFTNFLRANVLKKICERLLLNYIYNKSPTQVFSVIFVKCSRAPILQRIYEQLVLKHQCGGLSLIKLQAL